jgi:hypothetical protein
LPLRALSSCFGRPRPKRLAATLADIQRKLKSLPRRIPKREPSTHNERIKLLATALNDFGAGLRHRRLRGPALNAKVLVWSLAWDLTKGKRSGWRTFELDVP